MPKQNICTHVSFDVHHIVYLSRGPGPDILSAPSGWKSQQYAMQDWLSSWSPSPVPLRMAFCRRWMLWLVTLSGKVSVVATWMGTPTSLIARLGSGEMTVRPEKSTLFPDRFPLKRPCFPFSRCTNPLQHQVLQTCSADQPSRHGAAMDDLCRTLTETLSKITKPMQAPLRVLRLPHLTLWCKCTHQCLLKMRHDLRVTAGAGVLTQDHLLESLRTLVKRIAFNIFYIFVWKQHSCVAPGSARLRGLVLGWLWLATPGMSLLMYIAQLICR